MVAPRYFFDTYALVETARGSPAYAAYAGSECATTLLNLIEFYYVVLRDHGEETAREQFRRLRANTAAIADEDIFDGMKLKRSGKKRRLSYTDCIGYAAAKRLGAPFLTGDEQFKNMPNVRYVK